MKRMIVAAAALIAALALGAAMRGAPAPASAVSDRIALVAIDDASLRALGPWPWSRAAHARLVDALSSAGARRVVFDVDFSRVGTAAEDGALDAAIARARMPVVLAVSPPAGGTPAAPPNPVVAAHASTAFAGGVADSGGVVRMIPTTVRLATGDIPSLAAAADCLGVGAPRAMPVDWSADTSRMPVVSAADLLSGRAADRLRGRTVVIGATAPSLHDVKTGPDGRTLPGAVLHVIAANGARNACPS